MQHWSIDDGIFVYCSAEDQQRTPHHNAEHGPERIQPATLKVMCSACRSEAVELDSGQAIRDVVRTRGELLAALQSNAQAMPATCFACDAGENAHAVVYARCDGEKSGGDTTQAGVVGMASEDRAVRVEPVPEGYCPACRSRHCRSLCEFKKQASAVGPLPRAHQT